MNRLRYFVRASFCSCSLLAACSSSTSQTGGNGAGGSSGASGGGGTQVGGGGSTQTGGGGTQTGGGGTQTGGGGTQTGGGGTQTGGGGTQSGGSGGTQTTSDGGVVGTEGGTVLPPGDGGTNFGMWPAADPSKKGPYATETDNSVGPGMGFTMFRPKDLTQGGQFHPVVTWGNGTGTTPSTYSFILDLLASHGFVVIASNSMNVAQGTPPPMLDGVTWVFQENDDPMSPLYQHIDTAHVGATGHSQGAFATTTAGSDARITTIAPIEGTTPNSSLHGPALLLCGGQDTTVGCMGAMSAFTSDTVPVMYGELMAASHTSWITDSIMAGFGGGAMSPFVTAVTAWMRVQLMGDTSLKPMFYGASCTLCTDMAWTIQQKQLD